MRKRRSCGTVSVCDLPSLCDLKIRLRWREDVALFWVQLGFELESDVIAFQVGSHGCVIGNRQKLHVFIISDDILRGFPLK